jgi:amino acid adenylation domain-containing protein
MAAEQPMHRPMTLDSRKGTALPDSFVEHTLPGRFSHAARHFGQRQAINDGARMLSYSELNIESDDLARSIGRCAGDRDLPVCLLISQGADLIVAILAVLKSGRAYVPIDRLDSPEDIRAIIKDTNARLLLCDRANQNLAALVAPPTARCLLIDEFREMDPLPVKVEIRPDDDAYIYYTSGTTGRPKGVVDVHRNVLHNVLRYTNSLAIDHDDRMSLIQSSNFSGTVSTIFSALLNGATLFPFDFRRRGIAQLAQWINEAKITIFHSVPAIFEQLAETGFQFPSIRLIRLEGDRMLPRHLTLFKQQFADDCILVNGLASTETGLIRQCFFTRDSDNTAPVVPVGYAVKDMDVSILTADGIMGDETAIGEIVVRSPFLAKGYWRQPDLTAAKFVGSQDCHSDRYYRTGDLGRILPGGCLEHLGRGHADTKVRGRQADLAVIEQALCRLQQIRHALVKTDDGLVGGQLVAYVVKKEDAVIGPSELRRSLSGSIPDWLLPAHFVFLEALPVDRHGKVARHLLPQRSRERPELSTPYEAPKSLTARQLAACFAEVLQIDPVGVRDSFFDLGGDSLLATTLSFEIEKRFEIHLSPELIFDHPTVAALQSHLHNRKLVATAYPIRSSGSLRPLFCVHVYNKFASGYRRLAERLGQDQPVYVLRDSPPLISVEEIAASYLQAMQNVQPAGPYRICGTCFSGTIAYEMARQLQLKGDTIEFLGLFDTAFPPNKAGTGGHATAVARTSRWRHFSRSRLAKLALNLGLPLFRSWLKLHHAVEIAEARYRPSAITAGAVLFTIGPMDNQAGWKSLCGDKLTVVPIIGSGILETRCRPHLTDEPYVTELARVLTCHLHLASPTNAS